MRSETPRHEKIRFRRDELAPLDDLPSAVPRESRRFRRGSGRSITRIVTTAVAGVLLLVLVAVVGGYAILTSGIGEERLRVEAEAAIDRLTGAGLRATIGATELNFDGTRLLGVDVNDVAFVNATTGARVADIGKVRLGLRLAPLMRGEFRLANAGLTGARLDPWALPGRGEDASPLPIVNAAGAIDPDLLLSFFFKTADRFFVTLARTSADAIALEDVEMDIPVGDTTRPAIIRSARLVAEHRARLALTADIEIDGRAVTLSASADRDRSLRRLSDIAIAVTSQPAAIDVAGPPPAPAGTLGSIDLALTATRREGEADRLGVTGSAVGVVVDLRDGDLLPADVELTATATAGTSKLEIENLAVASNSSRWTFNGAVGPVPLGPDLDASRAYRFELVSDGSVIAAESTPEDPLEAVARFAGRYLIDDRVLEVDGIGLRTDQGEIDGRAAVTFRAGGAPGLELSLGVSGMPVSRVKQVWPWFAARGARNWAVENIYGGTVDTGRLDMAVAPGRLGNGMPLSGDEISGSFEVSETLFDIAGDMPPVRDGDGRIAFRGNDVDISLGAGTVLMKSGRSVAASNGTLTIREANRKPVIGKLAIDVEGAADAVMELARFDPIEVGRFIDIKPEDLSGDIKGRVFADIPLQRDIPADTLDWKVDLAYSGLDLAQPLEGQVVTDADGTISVDPAKAVIKAAVRLNEAPATIDMVEPLRPGSAERKRAIELTLDDKARRALVPGLDVLLSGAAKVTVDDDDPDRREISANLAGSTLSLPWVGWSKGSGVAASVDFAMVEDGSRTVLSDFRLSGETFAASGAIDLEGGDVVRARFDSARLNRGDDFSVDVQASGGGYKVTVRGKSIDARSVVKLYSQDSSGGTAEAGGESVPVTVDLAVNSMTGFHGETLSDVKLAYSGSGARTDRLTFSAVTDGGRIVTFTDGRDGGRRGVNMESADAGSVLRFLDIYEHMEGGAIALNLAATGDGPLRGRVVARNFVVVNEPRLSSIVSTPAPNDTRSLNQAVRGEIDTSRAEFEVGSATIEKGPGYLAIADGVLRGPLIGATYQGTLYDGNGNMAMTGTFMPAYGINRIFGEIPIIGQILGNGRDRGLIGITFKLAGKAAEPQLEVNPLSVIAPGIFRSVFEYR